MIVSLIFFKILLKLVSYTCTRSVTSYVLYDFIEMFLKEYSFIKKKSTKRLVVSALSTAKIHHIKLVRQDNDHYKQITKNWIK